MTAARRPLAPALVAGAAGALAAGTLALAAAEGAGPREFLAGNQATTWLAGIGLALLGALVLRFRPHNRLAPLMSAAGLSASVAAFGFEYATLALRAEPVGAGAGLAAWCAGVLWMPAYLLLLGPLPLLFPDGRLASPAWRWPARAVLVSITVAVAAFGTTQHALDDSGFDAMRNPLDLPIPDDYQLALVAAAMLVVLAVGAAATVAILLRMRRAEAPRRQQDAWFVAAVLLAALGSLLPLPDLLGFLANLAAFAALGFGIVRYGLFDIEVALSRTVVYGVLTAAALAVYVAAAALLGVQVGSGVVPAVVAAVAALVLASGRRRVQRLVDRMMYGQRHDPAAALTMLGERLGGAIDTDEVLPATVEAVRQSLRLPYAEVRLAGENAAACVSGDRPDRTEEFRLSHAGEDVGTLTVGLRRGEPELSTADSRLLQAFARQAGVAAHGVRATRELRRSRERVVASREEERLRIRRDLHDGLGPALAGISLGLETASRAVSRDGTAAAAMIDELKGETTACVDEVRRIVSDLRPPALDDAGLVGALRRQADLLSARSGGRLAFSVEEPRPIPGLPSAVEVAAYRIATEAMTNAIRHAEASCCRVSILLDGSLRLEVTDDGNGRPPERRGTGLVSMRDRAEELGGTCTVTFRPGSGTEVAAVLPVEVAA